MTQKPEMNACNWISWLVGIGAGVLAYWASVEAVTWLPAVLIAIAVGAFLALVLGNLLCGSTEDTEVIATVGPGTASVEKAAKAKVVEAQAEAEALDSTAAVVAETPDYDQDGVHEGEDEGKRPATLDAPRDGKADNLKEIKGIGPKLEKVCNTLGFYHFDQIASWNEAEIAWVNANLEGFKGRVSRDNWVEQAKILAAGGDTEFSARVDKGEVY